MSGSMVATRDGRELYVERLGAGTPTVVFESGMGCSRDAWGLVAPDVGERTGAAVYDRSGLGRSPADTKPRTFDRLVDDLCDVLDLLGSPMYVLVGHSWGGPIVRGAAARRGDVGGLVLVDQADEGCPLYFTRSAMLQHRVTYALLPLFARLGILRRGVASTVGSLSSDVAERYVTENGTVAAARGLQAEGRTLNADLARLRDEPLPTPAIPVSIISGTARARLGNARRDAIVAAHAQRAAALPNARHVEAAGSGHLVMLTEPEIVLAEIDRILDQLS